LDGGDFGRDLDQPRGSAHPGIVMHGRCVCHVRRIIADGTHGGKVRQFLVMNQIEV
jgi:hypothetical protein